MSRIYAATIPYFYVIRNTITDIRYAGCKYAKGCHPDGLLNKSHKEYYSTSSTKINAIISEHGTDIFEIEKLMTEDECGMNVLKFETRWLKDHGCSKSKLWYNMHDNMGGYLFTAGSEEFKNVILKSYGVENPSQSEEIRKKCAATLMRNYGVEYPAQSEEIRERAKETSVLRYGVTHLMKIPEIARERSIKLNITKRKMGQQEKIFQNHQNMRRKYQIRLWGNRSIQKLFVAMKNYMLQ